MGRSSACLLVVVVFAGCGEDGPPPSLIADIGALHVIVDRDPAVEALEIVDRVVAEGRPVHAASLLSRSAIPAAERQVELLDGGGLRTPEGNAFAVRLVAAYRERVSALETYRDVLEGGAGVDPMDMLDAIRARREAEQALLAIIDDMTAVVPPTPEPEPEPGGDPEEPEEGSD